MHVRGHRGQLKVMNDNHKKLTDLAVRSLEAWLALADVLVEHVSSSGRSNDLAQPIVVTGVRAAGSWQQEAGSRFVFSA